MWSKIEQYVKCNNLLKRSELYIIALSGGADSVALLLLLHEAGYQVEAAHCNFHLRGGESNRDERFCEQLCEEQNVRLHRAHFDTQTYAELHKVSIEMAARELRYRWFCQLKNDLGAAGVCVAHHRDDSVETVVLNLIRGTGLRGLCGIQSSSLLKVGPESDSELLVLRPLLCVSRAEIEEFLSVRGRTYVTDSTNFEADVLRNKVRLQVLPLLQTLNPAAVENIQRTLENLQGAQALLDDALCDLNLRNDLVLSSYHDSASREYVVYEWAKSYGFNGNQVRQILKAETGKVFTSPMGYDILKDRDRLLVEPSLKPMKPLRIPEEGTYVLDQTIKFVVRREPVFVSKISNQATVDISKVAFPLTVRRVEVGDRMMPYGMKGHKLLSDLMTDRKMTLFEKRRQLVVVDALGVVVWLVGIRVDARFSVDAETKDVLVLCFENT